ncbi:hypothetical protein MFORT_14015 [Mycolicibacterium fortuitum subsp. fortuitum DSM 46621 = ATCC 6841 = JCM 6387]|uniref:Uncharacterized protein n=1 Tax=Mycolicibacterium fortuitum subsp. fortuitum DSM 46621 = ATCC 6841 = JCM 6387 TaxID=1214102 RepID=K0VQH2_MYCFO|nr:hypothetical protein [Mycolicibacterium fortuitum]AIY45156.1 hypothetical protein G155_05775 [Mycobacterium sp. VKM Ac-1817D]EJZ13549.1 hypothetical protein MFORT_14015 [Mycolicibacterium fortuitum subsp. fortuitum DSM 46621 = ATCC 6841 = JCM 6387]OBG51123.1 hypothetical protein A5670_23200 [Mycolicibacterium fortuitum]OBJ98924.1 hypothetical protein A5638_01400 [Mycolicibacterium fortuitum]OBK68633.1 hypothetical protein A5654_14405 [Mycolicibacterium fortuitum]
MKLALDRLRDVLHDPHVTLISREFGSGNVSAPTVGADVAAVFNPLPRTASRAAAPAECSRPAHSADVAQSRLFEDILLDEIAELRDLVAATELRWRRLRERSRVAEAPVPEALVRLYARVAEAERLLVQLRSRFGYEGDSLRVI